MKILLIDIDSTIPNLALKKIEKYHIDKGDEVVWDFPLIRNKCDKIYVSCIFPENRGRCIEYEGYAEIGGTGYDIEKKLPPEIEAVKPRINWGFTTRGCIRNCYFCFVPKKEGKIRVVGDIYDIWDGTANEITLMDNNILAVPEHFAEICAQLKTEKLKVDFNQGLDHRLLTPSIAKDVVGLRHLHEIRFAFDNINDMPTVSRGLKILKDAGLRDWGSRWYVYISPKDSLRTVYDRMEFLRFHKQLVYVMRDKSVYDRKEWVALAQWGCTPGNFKFPLKDIVIQSERMGAYKEYLKELL